MTGDDIDNTLQVFRRRSIRVPDQRRLLDAESQRLPVCLQPSPKDSASVDIVSCNIDAQTVLIIYLSPKLIEQIVFLQCWRILAENYTQSKQSSHATVRYLKTKKIVTFRGWLLWRLIPRWVNRDIRSEGLLLACVTDEKPLSRLLETPTLTTRRNMPVEIASGWVKIRNP